MAAVRRSVVAAVAWMSVAALVPGCRPWGRLEITSWSPDTEFLAAEALENTEVWVEFSERVDVVRAEQAFALTEDGTPLGGRFLWEGNRMIYRTDRLLTTGKAYVMSVAAAVQTPSGLSLDRAFQFEFGTRSEAVRPAVASWSPSAEAVIDDSLEPVVVVFSEAMDPISFLEAFDVSPSVAGATTWSADGTEVTFTPVEPWVWQTEYTVTLGASAADLQGNPLPDDVSWRFFVGSDTTAPDVLSLRNAVDGLPGGMLATADDPAVPGLTVNDGWETRWGFVVTFSEPVRREGVEGLLRFDPAWDYRIESPVLYAATYILVPEERLAYDTLYTLTVREGATDQSGNGTTREWVYGVLADGPASTPPVVDRLRFHHLPVSDSAAYTEYLAADAFHALPLGAEFPTAVSRDTYFDTYLILADGASLNLMSLMSALSIQVTNGCATLVIRAIQDTVASDVPGCRMFRTLVTVTNENESGLVTFSLSGELVDSTGNPMGDPWELPLLK